MTNRLRETSQTKLIALVILLLLVYSYSYSESAAKNVPQLSSPSSTIKTYYKAYVLSDFHLQETTLAEWKRFGDEEDFARSKSQFSKYEILSKREVKKKEHSFHEKGDVEILVKETYANKRESIVSFLLRKFGDNWLIVDIVIEDKAEEPLDDGLLDQMSKQPLDGE